MQIRDDVGIAARKARETSGTYSGGQPVPWTCPGLYLLLETGAASWQSSSPSEFALPRTSAAARSSSSPGASITTTRPPVQLVSSTNQGHCSTWLRLHVHPRLLWKGGKSLALLFWTREVPGCVARGCGLLGLCGEITTRKEEAPCRCIIAHLFHLSLCRFSAIARCLKLRSKPAV